MTIDEIRKYAEEKGYPRKFLIDMIARLEAEYKDGNIDELTSLQLCAYINEKSEYWKRFFKFLDERKRERDSKKTEG